MNLDALVRELAELETGYASMPLAELQARRGAALRKATELTNAVAEAQPFDSDTFNRSYELALAFDRVGY